MPAHYDTGGLKYWSNGQSSRYLYRTTGNELVYWSEGQSTRQLFVPPSGQPYILRVQGVPGMRTFSQLGHGGL